jgi:OOP family OmpA-OmpF porin
MRREWFGILLLLVCSSLLAGCASKAPREFRPGNFETGKYAPKVENFQIIFDASESMDDAMNGEQRFLTAKNFVSSLNQSIPTDLAYNGGLRTFGHDPRQSKELTALAYGMTRYSRDGLAGGLASIKQVGGESPLDVALLAAGKDLKAAQGNSAIVVVSDGVKMEGAPATAAKIKSELGDKLCIYTVRVGASQEGKKTLEGVAKAGQCGTAVSTAALTDPNKFSAFVAQVFLTDKQAPAPAPVVKDSDGDGVSDHLDKCPGTPKGRIVDTDGCELKLTLRINFDFNNTDIKPEFKLELDKAAEFIRMNSHVPYILLAGHTDSIGEDDYNQKLSERRAMAVRQTLINDYGIDGGRLVARGYGEAQPVADNATEEGRYQNRRVEVICCVVIPD